MRILYSFPSLSSYIVADVVLIFISIDLMSLIILLFTNVHKALEIRLVMQLQFHLTDTSRDSETKCPTRLFKASFE